MYTYGQGQKFSFSFNGAVNAVISSPKSVLMYLDAATLGTAVYMLMTQGVSLGRFNVSIDYSIPDEVDTFKSYLDSTSTFPVCVIAWSRWGLEDKEHTVDLVTAGPSPAIPTPPDGTELNQFVYVASPVMKLHPNLA